MMHPWDGRGRHCPNSMEAAFPFLLRVASEKSSLASSGRPSPIILSAILEDIFDFGAKDPKGSAAKISKRSSDIVYMMIGTSLDENWH